MSIPFEPSTLRTPEPFGVIVILPLDTDTMSSPFTSKLPPSCGVLSSATFDIALDVAKPDTKVDLAIFLRPPPYVSIASNTSSSATLDISD